MNKPAGILEWIVTDAYGTKKVLFKDIFPNRDNIESIMMLWDTNSYYINVKNKYFLINGGRRVQPIALLEMEDLKPLAVHRHRKELSTNTMDVTGNESSLFLVGVTGIIKDEVRDLFLYISQDGSMWSWGTKR